MLKIVYQGNDFKKIQKYVLEAFDFVHQYFLIEISDVVVTIYTSRLEFDKYLSMKTEAWLVANASNNNEIAILSPQVLESDSSHSAKDFLPILKHEFSHLFVDTIAKGKSVPKWLDEGLASYVAKHHQREEAVHIKEGFCKELATDEGWHRNIDKGAYVVAAKFVDFLIKKRSLKEIVQLIESLGKSYDYKRFEQTFFNIYNTSLKDFETFFITSLNG